MLSSACSGVAESECDMVPLMVQKNFKAKGWLGLLLGARLWYAFWDADKDDDDSFENRVKPLVAEIGGRGKRSGGTGPKHADPARTVAPSPEPSTAPDPGVTAEDQAKAAQAKRAQVLAGGTVPRTEVVAPQQPTVAVGATLAELLAVFREEQSRIEARLARQSSEVMQAQRRVNDEQIDALQHRLQTLLDAGILEDQAFFACEDVIADNIEAMATGSAATDELVRMVALSERLAADASLARQLMRRRNPPSSAGGL
jgi:hypothetical protein